MNFNGGFQIPSNAGSIVVANASEEAAGTKFKGMRLRPETV
jgi:hypothetical protein